MNPNLYDKKINKSIDVQLNKKYNLSNQSYNKFLENLKNKNKKHNYDPSLSIRKSIMDSKRESIDLDFVRN